MSRDTPYALNGNKFSDQAEPSSENRAASATDMRILIELQVISFILHDAYGTSEDLSQLRQSIADSIT